MQDNKTISSYSKEYYDKNRDKFKIYWKRFFDSRPDYLHNWWEKKGYFIKVECENCKKKYNKDYIKKHKCVIQFDDNNPNYSFETISYNGILIQKVSKND